MTDRGCCRDSLPSMNGRVGGANVAVKGCCGDSLPSMDGMMSEIVMIEFEGVVDRVIVALFLEVNMAG